MSEAGEREIGRRMKPCTGVDIPGLDRRLQVSRLFTQVCPDQDRLRPVCGEQQVSGGLLFKFWLLSRICG